MDKITKDAIDKGIKEGMQEADIKKMAMAGAPKDEVDYALSELAKRDGLPQGNSTQDAEQELKPEAPETPEEVSGDAEEPASKQPSEFSSEDKETVERFVFNAMNIASGEHYDKMIAMAKSAKGNRAEGFGRALFFVLNSVKKGLEGKNVNINPNLWLSSNGLIEQTSKIVAILLDVSGVKLTPEDVQMGMGLASESLGMEDSSAQKEPPQPEQQIPTEQGMIGQVSQPQGMQ